MKELRIKIDNYYEELEKAFTKEYIENEDENLLDFGFSYKGTSVVNPFIDESGRFSVDPINYYGESFLKSQLVDLIMDFKGDKLL